jgi:hypothetical protein
MVSDDQWLRDAMEVYRVAFSEVLAKWNRLRDVEGEYLCEELREALLDLKQAVIEQDRSFVVRASDEVLILMRDLNIKYPEIP